MGEAACWIPMDAVLSVNTIDKGLKEVISETLCKAQIQPGEREVYEKMMSLTMGLLLEQRRGKASRFVRYVEALPEPPPTVNTFSPAEQQACAAMSGSDCLAIYQPLLRLINHCSAAEKGLWAACQEPSKDEVEQAFFFVLSRMSYMRLIPLIDLANAALPGEENASIRPDRKDPDGREGCAVVAKRPVAAGEELVIDYNHHHAIGMLEAYGCSLDMEKNRSVTTLRFHVPDWLKELGGSEYQRGVQLVEEEPAGLSEQVLLTMRMASMAGLEEVLEAIKDGYFKDEPSSSSSSKRAAWDKQQRMLYEQLAGFCANHRRRWQDHVQPALLPGGGVDRATPVGAIIAEQYETEMRLLRRCEEAMLRRAQRLG